MAFCCSFYGEKKTLSESRGGFVFGGKRSHRLPKLNWTVINSWFCSWYYIISHHVSPLSAGNRLERKKKIVYTRPGTLLKVIHFGQLKSTLYLKLIFLVLRANREQFSKTGNIVQNLPPLAMKAWKTYESSTFLEFGRIVFLVQQESVKQNCMMFGASRTVHAKANQTCGKNWQDTPSM